MAQLETALDTVIRECLGVAAGEDVLVIVDPRTRYLGVVLRDRAAAAGADAVLAEMDERATDGTEPPPTIAAALAAADVFAAPTSRSLSHTKARKWATEAGARGATMPGVTAGMLSRMMAGDFAALRRRSAAAAAALDRADEAHLTCPAGSDLRIDLRGRHGISDDGDLRARGAFGNLPCGEGFISPAGGEGRLAASSLATIGIARDPAVLTVSGGRLTDAQGPAGEELLSRLRAAGEAGVNLAELGVGTNDRAGLTGNILEDEKILGTVHVAFGASAGIGGNVSVPIHLDVVVLEPTLTVGDATVIEAGRFALE
ncbi:MAG: aminopeptidase [Actinomycetota bacterium]|nr:aminopeptidase [Actinomycetota bacterium]